MRGLSIIASVIFLALTISAAAIVYNAGLPAIQNLQTAAAVDKMKTSLSELDGVIRAVASEGQGSKRTVYISSDPGTLQINDSTNTIIWEVQTSAPVASPRTSQQFGNVIIGSNLDTTVTETTYPGLSPAPSAYLLENEHLRVWIRKVGSASSHTAISTNNVVLAIYNKDLGQWLNNPGFMDIMVDGNAVSRSGTGYTSADAVGSNLPYGQVKVFMDTAYLDYTISFRLESGTDFLIVEAEEGL